MTYHMSIILSPRWFQNNQARKYPMSTTESYRATVGIQISEIRRLHRCCRRMLEMKCVGDIFKLVVTILTISVTNIHSRYLNTSILCLQSFQLGFQVSSTTPFMWHHVTLKSRIMESRDPEGCNRIFRKWHANELN